MKGWQSRVHKLITIENKANYFIEMTHEQECKETLIKSNYQNCQYDKKF